MQNLYPLVWATLVICVFLVWFFSHKAKHRERLMMMEKGLDADPELKKENGFPWLKLGIIIIGLSVGLLIIAILAGLGVLDRWGNALPLAILGVCGGTAMVIANYVNGGKTR